MGFSSAIREDRASNLVALDFIRGVVAILLITLGLSRLKPAAPTVERATALITRSSEAPLERQVRAPGSLVPETEGILQIPASTDARVERLLAQAGNPVAPNTVLWSTAIGLPRDLPPRAARK